MVLVLYWSQDYKNESFCLLLKNEIIFQQRENKVYEEIHFFLHCYAM
jgi:hypothetical protein